MVTLTLTNDRKRDDDDGDDGKPLLDPIGQLDDPRN